MNNIVEFPDAKGSGGPKDPTMEQRVANLEKDMSRVLGILERLESRIAEKLEPKINELFLTAARQSDVAAVRVDVAELKGRIKGLEDRFGLVPTTWQIVSILAALLLGIAGIVFTAAKVFTP